MANSRKQTARKSARGRNKSNFRGTLAVLAAAACIGVGVYVFASPRPDASRRPLSVRASAPSSLTTDGKTVAAPTAATASDGRRPLSYYAHAVPSTLFEQPQPPAASAPVEAPMPVTMPAPVDPFAGWAYTGTIRQGNHIIALIENTSTHEGQYVSEGSWFLGDQVTHITDASLTITGVGTPHVMAKSQDFKMVPLDKSAAFLGSTGATAPKKPGAPPPPPSGAGAPAGGASNAMQQMRQRIRSMFRNFRGGGRAFGMPGGNMTIQMAVPAG
ncbi:MAG: hypothetical protein KGJ62_07460 [Armatimonadetes bacterium]|nr:hypothetical protein [Armatimonadota bacterium]MDE2207038.1 hypothetical protein [Armatimonadota bacterium]